MREIEIKLKVENLDELEKKFKDVGCIFSEPIEQRDMLYASDNNVAKGEGHIAIRIRQENNVYRLTLKQQRSNEMDNIECETEIKNLEAAHKMLKVLGWKKETIEVKKIRKKGKMGEYEVCLDKVEKLGNFMELEKMTDDNANPDEVRKELFEAIKPFGLTEADEETKGYDTQMYQLNKK